VTGVTIHTSDPFATPEPERSPVRRLRGRLPSGVALWTAPGPAGLTVSSTVIAEGDPARLLGLLDPESDLWTAIEAGGRFAVAPLRSADRQLADKFAGLMPAPGGSFLGYEWRETGYGPVLAGVSGWAGGRLIGAEPFGWSLLVTAVVERVELGPEAEPLVHYRGRYHGLVG
jgi:3-hydroxy-9,10-secoandrosta-1,3,5(10)-triene-9,17-dione monooxygenase reductase component